MKIDIKQLSLFPEQHSHLGGENICGMDHGKARRARYRIYYENGNHADVCGYCYRKIKGDPRYLRLVSRIEMIKRP